MGGSKKKQTAPAENSLFISLIHNYCDRWCERCPLTLRCAVFAMQQADEVSLASRDPENDAFWQHLHGIFSNTLEMVREMAAKAGVDVNDVPTPEEEAEEDRIDTAAHANPLFTSARAYMAGVAAWFKEMEAPLREKAEQLAAQARMALPGADPQALLTEMEDAVEVILWYHTLIGAKIHRAVRGELVGHPACIADLPKDYDGSAKVALISVERSIAAWALLRKHFPERDDETLDFLVQLERLRKATEQAFPDARAFVRPGFDELAPRN